MSLFKSRWPGVLLLVVLGWGVVVQADPLPTNGVAWREGIRNYLQSLPASSFDLPATPPMLTPLPADMTQANITDVLRNQLSYFKPTVVDAPGVAPAGLPLWVPGVCYTLAHIERTATGTTYYPDPPSGTDPIADIVQPHSYAGVYHYSKLTQIKYAGNPYFGSVYTNVLRRRSAVTIGVDLIIAAAAQTEPTNRYSLKQADNLGAVLSNVTYDYRIIKDVLPASVQAYYRDGIRELALSLASYGPNFGQYNRITQGFVGMYWAWEITQDPAVYNAYAGYISQAYQQHYDPAGYFPDEGNGMDAGYNGYNPYFVDRLAREATTDSLVVQYVIPSIKDMWKLANHLSLPDVDKLTYTGYPKVVGPNEFNSRTGKDAPNRSGNFLNTAVDAVLLGADEALLTLYKSYPDFHTPAAIYYRARKGIDIINGGNGGLGDSRYQPTATTIPCVNWKPDGFAYNRLNVAAENVGIYDITTVEARGNAVPEMKLYPVERPGDHIEIFGTDFVAAKFDNHAAIIHCGRVSSLERPNGYVESVNGRVAGYGGGQLAAFWTPDAGPVLLGRQRDNSLGVIASQAQSAQFFTNDWNQWRTWPIHAVQLWTSPNNALGVPDLPNPQENKWTSSARIQSPQRVIVPIAEDITSAQLWDTLSNNDPWASSSNMTLESPGESVTLDKSALKTSESNTKPSLKTTKGTLDGGASASKSIGGDPVDPPHAVAVYVRGEIPRSNLRFGGVDRIPFLNDSINYQRSFLLSKHKVLVETSVTPTNYNDNFTEACETIPVYWGDLWAQMDAPIQSGWPTNLEPLQIQLNRSVGGNMLVSNGTAGFVSNVNGITIQRFDGKIIIEFLQPQRVRVMDELWSVWSGGDPITNNLTYDPNVNDNLSGSNPATDYPDKRRTTTRTILIDLLNGQTNVPLPDTKIQYTIRRIVPLAEDGGTGGGGNTGGGDPGSN